MAFFENTLRTIRRRFQENFVWAGDTGASLSIWMGQTEVIGLHEGFRDTERMLRWDGDTLLDLGDAIMGPISATVLRAIYDKELNLDTKIGEVWPELAGGGVAKNSIGELLSQQCGLCVTDREITTHSEAVEELNKMTPAWEPGSGHGFHCGSFYYIASELVNRLSSKSITELWRDEFGDIMGLDLWIETPSNIDSSRLAETFPRRGIIPEASEKYFGDLNDSATIASKSMHFARPVSGVGKASSLAKFYDLFASGGHFSGVQVIPDEICIWAEQLQVSGRDKVLGIDTSFSAGFMKNLTMNQAGTTSRAFGFADPGGSLAFADPDTQISFAYTPAQRDRCALSPEKALKLVEPLYQF